MRTFFRKNWKLLLSALVIACLFCYPYLVKDFLGVEHDTFFHLSRIQGLAESFSRGDFLPAVYPYKNNGFGYASPLFYSDFWLIIPALLYNAGLSLASCYKFFIFCCVYFSCFSMMKLCLRACHCGRKRYSRARSGTRHQQALRHPPAEDFRSFFKR